jgi:hypothetical protein
MDWAQWVIGIESVRIERQTQTGESVLNLSVISQSEYQSYIIQKTKGEDAIAGNVY